MGASLTVPTPFDVILDGQGYLLADQVSSPVASAYGLQRATFGLTPTFVPRQNTQGNYGDNQQDAFLTVTQNDWSGGEQQKYFRGNDEERSKKFWRGVNADLRVPGEVSIRPSTTSITPAAAVTAACGFPTDLIYFATSTTLYHTNYAGTITSDGAHGLGVAPARFGMADDAQAVYMSSSAAGTVGIRKWIPGGAFSTFSATPADSLAYVGNTLYGWSVGAGTLWRYDTAGAATAIFVWRGADGNVPTGTSKILAFGGKLLILRYKDGTPRGAELWLYDGTAPAKIAEFPANFWPYDMEISGSTVYISGDFQKYSSGTLLQHRPAIYFYKDGTQGVLWQAEQYYYDASGLSVAPPLALYDEGLIFVDVAGFPNLNGPRLCYYDEETGAVSTLVDNVNFSGSAILASAGTFFYYVPAPSGTSGHFLFPNATNNAANAVIDSSLIDFDTSLPKLPSGIRADFDVTGTGTVDLAYRTDNLDGSYTTLKTGATSGVEYTITPAAEGTTYHSVSVRATLQRGATTTSQVKLKRISVRGLPILPVYKRRSYTFMLGGRDGKSPIKLRDGTDHALDGKEMATNLQTAASRTAPFTITDHLGTFTGRIEENGLEMVEFHPEQWVAHVHVREV